MEKNLIEVNQLTKKYTTGQSDFFALRNISFSVKSGEFVSIMGASGCGKSTLLYLIGGLDYPSSGTVLLNGNDINKQNDKEKGRIRRQDIGFVFQFYNLVKNLNVEENILLPVAMDGRDRKEYRIKLKEILDIVGLTGREKSLPSELSGGQQQRVAIARAVIHSPKLILADEPIGNLDSKSGQEIMNLFKQINSDKGITVLQVTHSHESAKFGKKIVYIKDGTIEREETC